jgi:uncharacterized protein YbcV (DUF1398 family)
MFTLSEIQTAHSTVKSGADFPAYIQALKKLGVLYYETFVSDGHAVYGGNEEFKISSVAKYDVLDISTETSVSQFITDLKAHQQGKTDYKTFCNDCAKSGILKWHVCLEKMTCTYFDQAEAEILVEQIPQ